MLSIRKATAHDAPLILDFIHRLAEYEREPDAVVATEEDLIRDGFGSEPKYRCLIAEWEGAPAGFALFHYNYSTWRGHAGLYLEDLFVRVEMRGKGIGKALLQRLAQIALEESCYGLRWMVLEWNEPALKFYESLGAELLCEWETMLLRGEALERLAEVLPQRARGTQRSLNHKEHEEHKVSNRFWLAFLSWCPLWFKPLKCPLCPLWSFLAFDPRPSAQIRDKLF